MIKYTFSFSVWVDETICSTITDLRAKDRDQLTNWERSLLGALLEEANRRTLTV